MPDLMAISRRVFIAGACAAAASPACAGGLALAAIVARNTAARGGPRRLAALRTMESQVRITEQGQKLDGRYLAAADGMVRVDIFDAGQRVFTEGVDGGGVWSWPGGLAAPRAGSGDGKAALLHGVLFNLVALAGMPARGVKLALVPDPSENGLHCIQLTLSDGFETRLYVSPKTWQVVKREDRRAYHPDVENTSKRIESRFSDFRASQGVVSAWRSEDFDLTTGKMVGMGETLALAWNVPTAGRIARSAAFPSPPVPG